MPDHKKIVGSIHKYIENAVISLDQELVGVEYIKEGAEWILRITIDKLGGISHDDCQKASLAVELILEAKDIMKEHYILEVSSPGFDRPLITNRDMERVIGQLVEIHQVETLTTKTTAKPSGKPVEGILQAVTDDEIEIILDEPFIKGIKPKTNGQVRRFTRKDIKLIKRAIRI